jgi:Chaperone of endosialidase
VYAPTTSTTATSSNLVWTGSSMGVNTSTPDVFSRGYGTILGVSNTGVNGTAIQINSSTSSYPVLELGRGGVRKAFFDAQSTVTEFGNLEAVPLAFFTNGTETMRLTSSGNLGIGTTTVNNPLVIATTGISGTYAHFNGGNNTDGGANPWLATVNSNSVSSATYGWAIYNSATDGNLKTYVFNGSTTPTLIQSFNRTYGSVTFGSGQATVGNFNLYTAANTQNVFYMVKNGQVEMTMGFKSSTDSNFYVGTGSSTIGTNGVYLTNGGAAWLAVSDERFKENLVPITDAITKVNGLRSVTGNFIADENKTRRPFLIAQDVLTVLPEAVDTSDSERYGLGYTDIIPLLVASIKELSTLTTAQQSTIQSLTDRITALEAK